MSDKIYPVPQEWKARAYIDEDKYHEMYERSLADPNGFWAMHAKRLHWYKTPTKIKNTSFNLPNVSIKWFEDGVQCRLQLYRPASAEARQAGSDHLGGRRSCPGQEDHLPGIARRGLPLRQHPAQSQCREGRSGHNLHADDPGGSLCHAGLCAA